MLADIASSFLSSSELAFYNGCRAEYLPLNSSKLQNSLALYYKELLILGEIPIYRLTKS